MSAERADAAVVHPSQSESAVRRALLIAALLSTGLHLLLSGLQVPLGNPGRFVYLYSPLAGLRLLHALPMMLIGLAAAAGVLMLGSARAAVQRSGLAVLGVLAACAAVWTYCAPPHHVAQHLFNIHSPSHDGAFVEESWHVASLRSYLADFPVRAETPPEQMRGTRVISNPPGLTLLAHAVDWVQQRQPWLATLVTASLEGRIPEQYSTPQLRRNTRVGFGLWWLMTAGWVLALLPLYALARYDLPPASAAAFAACAVFTPATLLLSPGKDAFQLLSAGVALWAWVAAFRGSSLIFAATAGFKLVIISLLSLVHLWLAAVVLVATLVYAHGRRTLGRTLVRVVGVATLGAAAAIGLLALLGCNWFETMLAVFAAQARVTRGPDAMPLAWQVLGIPLFLLFCGPALYVACDSALRNRGRHGPPACSETEANRRWAWTLLAGSALVLVATVGFTNIETPRLWIPFVPLLLLSLWLLGGPAFHAPRVLAMVVCVQLVCGALQWSRMDMREAETRVLTGVYFGDARGAQAPQRP